MPIPTPKEAAGRDGRDLATESGRPSGSSLPSETERGRAGPRCWLPRLPRLWQGAGVFRLGITGGIGMGKSSAAEILAGLGVSVVDTDRIAREVVAPGQPALNEVFQAFGEALRLTDGSLDRARLGRVVFADPDARRRLEAMLHPRIREVWMAQLEAWETAGVAVGAVVIPLLFETQAESVFHQVACLACTEASQRLRLRQRGWSDEEIDRRRDAQWPVAAKIERSHAVIWTEPPVTVQAEQWHRWLADRDLALVTGRFAGRAESG